MSAPDGVVRFPRGQRCARGLIIAASVVLSLLPPARVFGNTGANDNSTAKKLETVRSQIKNVQSNIQSARERTDAFLAELKKSEVALAAGEAKLHEIDGSITQKNDDLKKLRAKQARQRRTLASQRTDLRAQIQAAYKIGRQDYLKLLLNQQDPSSIGRVLAYHDYFNRARSRRIKLVKAALARLDKLHTQIRSETGKLEALKSQQLAKLKEIKGYRTTRQATIDQLRNYISSQGNRLAMLQHNEKELEALLNRLRSEKTVMREYRKLPPFASLKGKLTWPVKGRIIHHYGAPGEGGQLRARGVTISANAGTKVHAVSAGKVIFADWFRNMGLLIIVDHGDGFMSLYGHNSRLLKKAGDMVKTGDVIALVGDTGGETRPELYFEIRKTGVPVNPDLWCRG